jgi:asparagine synthase (glutamine-hydrolysing)
MLTGAHLPYKVTSFDVGEQQRFQEALRIPRDAAPKRLSVGLAFIVGYDLATASNGDSIAFSGHIQNRAEVRRVLGLGLVSDAQLYAAGYVAWGDEVDVRVIGSYATIVLAAREPKIRLTASPLSCPPLHYYHDGKQFMVASRAQALFDTGRIERILSEQKVADSLFLNYEDREQGWFEGVTRLAGGTRAYVTPDGVTISRYYDLISVPTVRMKTDRDYVEAAEELFCQGTRGMLDGFKNPAVSVSGGYDSQAVAAYAMLVRPDKPLLGYTGVPEAEWDGIINKRLFGNERPHVEALAAMYPQFRPAWITADGLSFDHFQRDMFEFSGQAQRNAMNLHWIHEIKQQAKSDGCDVLLTGSMGNATFSYAGDQAFSGWLAKGQIIPLMRELLATGPIGTLPRRFVSKAVMPLLPRGLWERINRLRHGAAEDPFDSWCPMDRDYAEQMNVSARATAVGFDPLFRPPALSREWRAKVLTMAGGEGTDTMLAMEIIHGIPSRDPTSYRPLVEFCVGIPDDQYLRNGVRRWLAKRMLAGKVPEMVLQETRRGRQAADWHLRLSRQREELIEEIDWLMEDPTISVRLNLSALRQALVDFPDQTPTDKTTIARLKLAVSRGLTTARFIRYLEGRNS